METDVKKATVALALARPGDIIGYGKNGKPWYLIAGGSQQAPEQPIITDPNVEPAARVGSAGQGTHPVMREEPTPPGNPQPTIEEARRQEREKVMADLQKERDRVTAMETQLKEIRDEREREAAEREQRKADREAKAAADAKKAEEENLSALELLQRRDEEFTRFQQEQQQRMQEMQQQIEQRDVLLQREREYQQFVEWRRARVEESRNDIAPQLIDLVQGESVEEVEASIAGLIDRTNAILEEFTQAQATARQGMRGTSPTAPPAGPLENIDGARQFSPEEIAQMPMGEYAKYRSQLLGAASRRATDGGLYG